MSRFVQNFIKLVAAVHCVNKGNEKKNFATMSKSALPSLPRGVKSKTLVENDVVRC